MLNEFVVSTHSQCANGWGGIIRLRLLPNENKSLCGSLVLWLCGARMDTMLYRCQQIEGQHGRRYDAHVQDRDWGR